MRKYLQYEANDTERAIIKMAPTDVESVENTLMVSREKVLREVRNSGYLTRIKNNIWVKKAGKRPELQEESAKTVTLELMEEVNFKTMKQKDLYDLFLSSLPESVKPVSYQTFTSYIRRFRKQYYGYWEEIHGN